MLGTDQYGIWMFVNSIIASIGIVNVGIGDAAIKFISKYRALEDKTGINRIINTGFSLVLILALIIVVIGLVVSLLVKQFNIFNLTTENIALASVSIQLGSVVFALKQVEQLLISFFKGYERYDTGSGISIISKFVLLVSQVIVVVLGYQLVQIYLISVFASVLLVLCEIVFVKSKFKDVSLFPSFNKSSIKEIFSFSTWSWVQSILSVIFTHVDRFIVITLAGPTFLAYYTLASVIGTQIHMIMTAGVSWVFPKVSAKTERKEDTSDLYYKMQFLIIIIGFVLITFLLLFENIIFKTWLGTETYTNSILLIKIFLYLGIFYMLSIIPYFFLLGANLIRISALFMFISVVITIIFMILCYQFMDYIGLAYGKLFSAIVSIPLMLAYIHYRIIDKKNLFSGIKVYLPVGLLALSVYTLNIISIPLFIGGAALLWLLYKEKVAKFPI
jgi:O-antigen/teichoic acid export membrane protein